MTIIDEESATERERYCPDCGHLTTGARYCPGCGHAVGVPTQEFEAPTIEQPGFREPAAAQIPNTRARRTAAPGIPSTGSSSPSRRVWVGAAGLLILAVAALVAIVALNGSGSGSGASYRQKLGGTLAPVVAANQALTNRLDSLHGRDTSAVTSAVNQAQDAVLSARGAVQVLSAPTSSSQLSQQVQQALTTEGGYLQVVSATLSRPSAENIAQLQPLTTSLQSALVPLAGVAPGVSTSLGATNQLSSWASGRVAAAARASAAASRASQQRAVQQAATKAASKAARQAPSNNAGSSGPATAAIPAYGVQDLPVQCGFGVAGSAGVSCAFAENAFYEYWSASAGNPVFPETIYVWSAEGQAWYGLSCSTGDGVVDCTGTNGSGAPIDARFTQSAVSAYTTSGAAAYAASGKLGP